MVKWLAQVHPENLLLPYQKLLPKGKTGCLRVWECLQPHTLWCYVWRHVSHCQLLGTHHEPGTVLRANGGYLVNPPNFLILILQSDPERRQANTLPCSRHCSKSIKYTNSFNSCNNAVRQRGIGKNTFWIWNHWRGEWCKWFWLLPEGAFRGYTEEQRLWKVKYLTQHHISS